MRSSDPRRAHHIARIITTLMGDKFRQSLKHTIGQKFEKIRWNN
jgi:hypothetical protein